MPTTAECNWRTVFTHGLEDRCKPLLARRVPRDEVTVGRAYVIHARNGGVGVAVMEDGCLGYQLHREKFGSHYLFVEPDWDQGPPHGTAIPLAAIDIRAHDAVAFLVARKPETATAP